MGLDYANPTKPLKIIVSKLNASEEVSSKGILMHAIEKNYF
jgi:hypothetical protein